MIDWPNLIAIFASMTAIAAGLYRFIHRDFQLNFELINKNISRLEEEQKNFKEEQKDFKKELKIIHEKSERQDMRLDGIYKVLLEKYKK